MLNHIRIAPFICIAFITTTLAAEPTTRPASGRRAWPERQIVWGLVQNANGHPVPGAIVFMLDAETGIPYSNVTDHPFADMHFDGQPPVIALAAAGVDGRFHIRGVFPGTYRVVAQSWSDVTSVQDLAKTNSDTITLRGIVGAVAITENQAPPPVVIKPAGTATVAVTLEHEDTYLFVSTKPLSADMLLGPLAWKGEFAQNLVGAIYVRKEHATLHGLPEGRLYFAALYNDRQMVFGETSVIATAGERVETRLSLVSPRNGPRQLPERLVPLSEEYKRNRQGVERAIREAVGPEIVHERDTFNLPLDREVVLPSGKAVTLRDIATVNAYEAFNHRAQELANRSRAATQPSVP